MAFVPKQLPDEEENQFGRTAETTPTPAPQGGSSAGTGQGGVAPGVGTPTQFGSNAAKLTDYLNANKEQVGEFGQQVAGKLGEQYNEAKGAIDQGFQNYNQELNSGYNPADQNKVNQAAENPFSYAQDPNNVSQFQSWYNNQYTGPQNVESWQPYQNINSSVNSAVQNAGLTNNFAGLGTYLNNFMGSKGTSTPGMNTLDTALLQRNPDANQAIRQAAQPFQGLTDYLGGKVSEGNTAAQNAKQDVDQSRESIRNKFTGEGGVIPSFQQDLNSRLSQKRQSTQSAADSAIKNLVNKGNLSDKDLEVLGITRQQANSLFENEQILSRQFGMPVDFNQFVPERTPADVVYGTADTVATSDDYAKAQALQQLTGQNMGGYLNPELASQAGSVNSDLVDFNPGAVSQVQGQRLTQDMGMVSQYSGGIPGGFAGLKQLAETNPAQAKSYIDSIRISYPNLTDKEIQSLKDSARRMGIYREDTLPPAPYVPDDTRIGFGSGGDGVY